MKKQYIPIVGAFYNSSLLIIPLALTIFVSYSHYSITFFIKLNENIEYLEHSFLYIFFVIKIPECP